MSQGGCGGYIVHGGTETGIHCTEGRQGTQPDLASGSPQLEHGGHGRAPGDIVAEPERLDLGAEFDEGHGERWRWRWRLRSVGVVLLGQNAAQQIAMARSKEIGEDRRKRLRRK